MDQIVQARIGWRMLASFCLGTHQVGLTIPTVNLDAPFLPGADS
jgi:hypothetical protein